MHLFSKFILFVMALVILSCAKTDDEQVRSAIQEAKYYLNSMDCTSAKEILDDVGYQDDNGDYISIYASVYGCKAGYKELDFLFGGNLDLVNSASLIKSLAQFDSSNETVNESDVVVNIDLAIKTLIGSDGVDGPSTITRNAKFGTKKSGDLSLQALYLIFVAMGKHFALYGNADRDSASATFGDKGAGTGSNTCIFSYVSTDARNYIDANTGVTGSCVGPLNGTQGSDLLEAPETAADIKTRLCRGIIYYNNMLDILSNIAIPGSTELGNVSAISTALNGLMTTAEGVEAAYNTVPADVNAIQDLKDIRSQAGCEAETIGKIEKFYAILFEFIYQ